MTKLELCANYRKVGNKLINGKIVLLIRERDKPTSKKPKNFLLKLNNPDSNKGTYISSLYPSKFHQNTFTFDYQGKYYKLQLDAISATIRA
jgi:hypothetical protein